ncbi:uncharacterized protein Z519_03912 [Cladophialophora bantiana CBS 173.52]|uniref:Alpha/beta hydrolase fold-3 domain-containing protein n=1 Tax=Cladophialophora bantiana (strain ATCC 10958 / CBS 173.52 / CDC B-1940 / NIH 8579) TaxID=1442370 RepID=A0A0D2HPJ4_CLAB1|nr:uncharacterized protein Z519_03912 [Cladophialophora bantiana CBS 173.52]KIW95328.1 hypothetical protein Z519_03912 [Cladophialophora bantiana CBS 173.52]
MAAVSVTGTAGIQDPSTFHEQDVSASPDLQRLCRALGMNPDPANKLQIPNFNFLQEMAKLPTDLTAIPRGTDVQAMRHWIDNVFLKGPLAEYRARCDIQRRRSGTRIYIKEVSVQCSDGSQDTFNIRVYEPQIEETISKRQLRPAILMLHGGGWIHGNSRGDETVSTLFATELGAVVLGVDYRLAPEHPFPAPLEDCSEAIAWTIRNAETYQIDTSRIALWGASAGGNLAAAVSIKHSRERSMTGYPSLRLVNLVVPVTAHPKAQAAFNKRRLCERSRVEETVADVPPAPEPVVKEFETLYELYVGNSTDIYDHLASPLMAQDISQHPKTHITVAACDYLMHQGLAYAQLLRSFGTHVTEEILAGVPHGFTFPMNAAVTKKWLENQRDIFMAAFSSADA